MPLLYLAKINLNSRIFDVYTNKLDIKDVSELIYENIKDGINYSSNEKSKHIDTYGNSSYYLRDSKYAFQEIYKYNGIIMGKLVRTFNKPTEIFDENKKQMTTTYITENVSIFFYYDVFKELLTFCERQAFGYNQFTKAFAKVLNACTNIFEFEIFLQKDRNLLDEKIKDFKSIQRVRAKLIPPNSNSDEIQILRSESEYLKQCEETNSKRMNIEYMSDNMNMESRVMKEIITAVSQGYGDITATGINKNNRTITINSSQEAAFTSNIKENIDRKGFIDESKSLIDRFLSHHNPKIYRRNQ